MSYSRNANMSWGEYALTPTVMAHGSMLSTKLIESSIDRGFLEMGGILENIEDSLSEGFSGVMDGVGKLGSLFDYRMVMAIERMDKAAQHLQSIANSLEEISKTLKTPAQTQALEFREIGLNRMARGLYDKALESFKKAEAINDADFLLCLQMGKIYLYGHKDSSCPVDINNAQKYLSLALRYSLAESLHLNKSGPRELFLESLKLTAEIELHLSQLCCIIGNGLYFENHAILTERVLKMYALMLSHAQNSDTHTPSLEAKYMQAKAYALMGKEEEAKNKILTILSEDFSFLQRVEKDEDFKHLLQELKSKIPLLAAKGVDNKCMQAYELARSGNKEVALTICKAVLSTDIMKYSKFQNKVFKDMSKDIDDMAFWSGLSKLGPIYNLSELKDKVVLLVDSGDYDGGC